LLTHEQKEKENIHANTQKVAVDDSEQSIHRQQAQASRPVRTQARKCTRGPGSLVKQPDHTLTPTPQTYAMGYHRVEKTRNAHRINEVRVKSGALRNGAADHRRARRRQRPPEKKDGVGEVVKAGECKLGVTDEAVALFAVRKRVPTPTRTRGRV